jgi:flagellar biosynthesis protein FliQ
MTVDLAVEIYRETLRTAAFVAAPILGTAMAIGIGLALPWILAQLMTFLTLILTHAPGLVLPR